MEHPDQIYVQEDFFPQIENVIYHFSEVPWVMPAVLAKKHAMSIKILHTNVIQMLHEC
jgi:hypothetical protein